MVKAKTYQKPKADHPWRQYANKRVAKPDRDDVIHIKEFLGDMVDNWDKYEVYDRHAYKGGGFRKIKSMPQKKVAMWLANRVKKIYIDEL